MCWSPENTKASYLEEGEVRPGQRAQGNMVQAEITTSFFVLIGIFFPSVTGQPLCFTLLCVQWCVLQGSWLALIDQEI